MQKNKEKINIQDICNACGKKLELLPSGQPEETLRVDKTWGYFSKKDTQRHRFMLCEECYDRLIASFAVPVEVSETHEVL